MSNYTPNTDVIRQAVTFERNRLGEPRTIKVEAFERWLAAHDAEVEATERARIVKHLSSSSIVTVAGKGGALEWLRKTEPEGN